MSDPDAVVGIGLYDRAPGATERGAGNDIDRLVKHDGRLWELRSFEETRLPADRWTVAVPESDEGC